MVKIMATVQNEKDINSIILQTGDNQHSIIVAPKANGFGSSMNGGEALMLALATCYCNDIYREAEKAGLLVYKVAVEVECDFDGVSGHPVENIKYHVQVDGDGSQDEIETLIHNTDTLAEIHNTLRRASEVSLASVKVIT